MTLLMTSIFDFHLVMNAYDSDYDSVASESQPLEDKLINCSSRCLGLLWEGKVNAHFLDIEHLYDYVLSLSFFYSSLVRLIVLTHVLLKLILFFFYILWVSVFKYIPHKWIMLFAHADWLARRWLAKYSWFSCDVIIFQNRKISILVKV